MASKTKVTLWPEMAAGTLAFASTLQTLRATLQQLHMTLLASHRPSLDLMATHGSKGSWEM